MAEKQIGLIRGGGSFWGTVEAHLREVNAQVVVVDAGETERLSRRALDLLVLDERAHASLEPSGRHAAMLVIHEGGVPERARVGPGIARLAWPVTKSRFLEATSRLLKLPPRRAFRSLVRVFLGDGEQAVLAQSVDFSLAGMGLSTAELLPPGSAAAVSFSLPDQAQSLRVRIEIVRRTDQEGGGLHLYGVKFLALDARARRAIEEFVSGA